MLPHPSTGYSEACWPLGGEIDIAGAHGKGRGGPGSRPNTVESGYHFAPQGRCGVDSEARSRHPAKNLNLDQEFHTFAVEWDKSSLRYYVDDVLTNVLDKFAVPIVPRWPFYLILNTEMSPFGMPDAMTECEGDFYHHVDYVRVYKRAEVAVHVNVYRFLSFAAIGALATLSCVACIALRRTLDDDEQGARDEDGGGRGSGQGALQPGDGRALLRPRLGGLLLRRRWAEAAREPSRTEEERFGVSVGIELGLRGSQAARRRRRGGEADGFVREAAAAATVRGGARAPHRRRQAPHAHGLDAQSQQSQQQRRGVRRRRRSASLAPR
jgi:hypothetical protein